MVGGERRQCRDKDGCLGGMRQDRLRPERYIAGPAQLGGRSSVLLRRSPLRGELAILWPFRPLRLDASGGPAGLQQLLRRSKAGNEIGPVISVIEVFDKALGSPICWSYSRMSNRQTPEKDWASVNSTKIGLHRKSRTLV